MQARISLKEAQRMVEEDIMEAQKAEIGGVPTYIMEDGTVEAGSVLTLSLIVNRGRLAPGLSKSFGRSV